ncbi:hypothetical protein M758_3G097700 [Ceratodon purpureus]|uniref:Uncharacterized protein n=1 Tax=Ceratodon purpureus TaxID=3225 RepID=A0A8T0IJ00_CERPU|nr:hypothetical protein KC19_N000500 [Ceratodon purpureus]KAG0582899.1 hypothetical protein KC19_3G094400 [Ceratodon purpureus]KAG0622439.1 hypothetical protein M758_3G097700 [Ceratodon purpureus]
MARNEVAMCVVMLLLIWSPLVSATGAHRGIMASNEYSASRSEEDSAGGFGKAVTTVEKVRIPKEIPKVLKLIMSNVSPVFRALRIILDILDALKKYTTVKHDKEKDSYTFCFGDECKSNCDWGGFYDEGNLTRGEGETCINELTKTLEDSYDPTNQSTRFIEGGYYSLEEYPYCTVVCNDGYLSKQLGSAVVTAVMAGLLVTALGFMPL